MSISEKDIKEEEDKYKNAIYGEVEKMNCTLSEIIEQYTNNSTKIPNISITFNNKLNEISQIFKRAGISMFAEYNKEYDFIDINFVGNAIIEDMISQLSSGVKALSKYNDSINNANKKREERIKELEKSGPIKKLFLKLRSFFVTNTVSNLTSYSKEEIEDVNSNLSKYNEIDENLCEYNLRDNVAQSLAKLIIDRRYDDFTIPAVLEESIGPTLKKLGVEDVIPQVQEELNKLQEQSKIHNSKSWDLSTIQRLGIQISSKQIANEFEQNENSAINKDDKEYDN